MIDVMQQVKSLNTVAVPYKRVIAKKVARSNKEIAENMTFLFLL